ncbi:MAG TPA: hypothetical protein VF286_10495 [Acidiphilium sp.]
MSGERGADAPQAEAVTGLGAGDALADLARDWIVLWQSELAAMAQDREMREAWTGLLTLWAGAANSAIDIARRTAQQAAQKAAQKAVRGAARHEREHVVTRRPARTDAPARPSPGDSAPASGGDTVERLHRRIAELEERLATLERAALERRDGPV